MLMNIDVPAAPWPRWNASSACRKTLRSPTIRASTSSEEGPSVMLQKRDRDERRDDRRGDRGGLWRSRPAP